MTEPAPCPICHRQIAPPMARSYRPFCSRRCADIDLGRWFGEEYRIPVPTQDPSAADDDNLTG